MIAELEHDEERQALTAKPFTPGAYYDDDGDCIEFLAENSAFNARRLDDFATVPQHHQQRRTWPVDPPP